MINNITLRTYITMLFALIFASTIQAGVTTRVSVASDGSEANDKSEWSNISGNGKVISFASRADNLVEGDTNGMHDAFVHDLDTGITTRISVASDGTEGNNLSGSSALSADGSIAVFTSWADNLVPDDTNGYLDTFIHDRTTGVTSKVGISARDPDISADGNYIAFISGARLVPDDNNGLNDIYVYNRTNGETTRASVASDGTEGDGFSTGPSISGDGRFVAFRSYAKNLVPGQPADNITRIFVRDRLNKVTTLVSIGYDNTPANGNSDFPQISSDGRFITYYSRADNLVAGDTNGFQDILVFDRENGTNSIVSVDSSGNQANGVSYNPSISGDGRFVTFVSSATNLIPQDINAKQDIFRHDRQTGETSIISTDQWGNGANGNSYYCTGCEAISDNGRAVVYSSLATNIISVDTNNVADVFHFKDGAITASIDVKPGDETNCFNINGHGVIPVAILGDGELDVTQIDHSSLMFAGLAVRVRGNQGPLCHQEFVNGDTYPDLVCQFEDDPTTWLPASNAEATLTGETFDGFAFEGTDSICLI